MSRARLFVGYGSVPLVFNYLDVPLMFCRVFKTPAFKLSYIRELVQLRMESVVYEEFAGVWVIAESVALTTELKDYITDIILGQLRMSLSYRN